MKIGEASFRWAWYGAITLVGVLTYFYGLDSQHIPKNGDEYPYEHITRLTAASGHLLPLQSELNGMRNTKPPLLTWQGIASTDWGQHWTLWHLRYPSVVYTLLTALMAFLLAWRISGRLEAGLIALLTFLAFYSTYRYGRPYLTNAPETFWLFLPFFVLLYWHPASFGSRLFVPLLLGIGTGIGLLYKSFALAMPIGIAISWWYLHYREYRWPRFLAEDSWKVVVILTTALALFSAWFLLDPDPQAVWTEFVISENAGKLPSPGGSYLSRLLWSTDSIWTMVLAYPYNAGALLFPVAALMLGSYKRRDNMDRPEKLLWIWIIVLAAFFTIPSQRTPRNLLAAMPALAVLCALNWDRISRKAFIASVLLTGAVVAVMVYLSVRLQQDLAGDHLYSLAYWCLVAFTGVLVLVAVFVPSLTRSITNAAIILAYCCLSATLRPFDAEHGDYSADVQRYLNGKVVWVPCDFRAKDEGYRFIFPGIEVHGYRDDRGRTISELEKQYPLFAARVPLDEANCTDCKVIGERLNLHGRQNSAEIKEMLRGAIAKYLFVKERLIESQQVALDGMPSHVTEGCR
jgi:hypothetical protein